MIDLSAQRLRSSVCITALYLAIAGPAFAQESPPEEPEQSASTEASAGMQEVHITGSRIQREDGMTTPTPVTAVSAQELQQLAPTTLMAGLDQLPQFVGNETTATTFTWTNNAGASTLNLRGLGANRTLTLLDGRRVVPSTRLGSTDVGIFPEPLVARVDVVTGGASAAYGSDAVAGVVNFILDTEFTGLKGDLQTGISDRGDNKNYKIALSGGMPIGDKMHLLLSADYFKSEGIDGYEDRDWNEGWGVINNPAYRTDKTVPQRITVKNLHSRAYTQNGLITSGPLAGTQFLADGTPARFFPGTIISDNAQVGGSGEDIGPEYSVLPTTKRGSLFAHLKYDLNDDTELYVQGIHGYSFSHFKNGANLVYGAWAGTIFADNAYLPESLASQMAPGTSFSFGRAGNDDLSNQFAEMVNNTSSITTGVKGKISDWRYNGYYQYGQNRQTVDLLAVPRIDRLYRSMDSIVGPNGQIICRSTLSNPNDGCVPGNFFGSNLSEEALDYIIGQKTLRSITKQHYVEGAVDGEVFDGWAGAISLALGASYRRESVNQAGTPPGTSTGEPGCTPTDTSQGYDGLPNAYSNCYGIYERASMATVVGSYEVKEVFAETLVPLLKDLPFAKGLDLSAAVRHAHYSGSGGVVSWKGGLDWTPYADLRIRGTLSRDTRAGSLAERFDLSSGGASANDPFREGNPNYAFTAISGGNAEIDPEKADTKVLGFVYQPSYLEGFALSVDYFDIKTDDAIATLGVQRIIDACFEGAASLCSRITRGPDGLINNVLNTYLNVNETRATGWDIETSYRRPINVFGGGENLTLRAFFSHMTELSTTVDGIVDDNAGQTGLTGPVGSIGGAPDWRGTMTVGYSRGPLSVSVQERWINSGTYDASWVEGRDIDTNRVSGIFYTNLRLGYDFERGDGTLQAYVNVSNLFDRDPVVAATYSDFFGSSHTNEALFDKLGRTYVAGVKLNF